MTQETLSSSSFKNLKSDKNMAKQVHEEPDEAREVLNFVIALYGKPQKPTKSRLSQILKHF